MINIEQFRQNIEDWMINVVSIPNPLTGNFPPCPYAKAAWLNNRVSLRWFHGSELPELLMEQRKRWNDDFEMVIFGCDPQNLDAQTLEKYITEANYVLPEYDLVALASHPDKQYVGDDPNNVNNVIITHPKYVLASVQSFSQLQEASDELFRLGYFQYWSEEKLAEMKAERAYQKLSYSQRKNSRRIIPTYH
uniref:Uncharacterized protein n=1 Tax=Aphanizomenon gracile NIVA-CYA 655 TaxID=1847816 RepID=A0A1M4BLI6_9CYAN|nr:unknown [Aphanizomenon gracile NIVA-CYA 655]